MERELQRREFCNIQLLKSEILGNGSYGVVCKATCDGHLCAAKLLHPIFFQSNDPGMVTTRERFEQECHFLSEMTHPHIIQYLGTTHDPDSGLLVLLMELMDESLTHFLEQSQQPLAYHIEVDLCHDIAQALAYIHSNGIIHRDLSSNNILVLAGKAKITDFGQSKLLDVHQRMTPLTVCPGTHVYMPPEALKDIPSYSKKIDCFSYGVLEIQIMTRQFPEPGPSIQEVEDPRSPVGTINIPVPDSERRKSHIDLIDPTHALLPMALNCLSYSERNRPSAQDLCQQLATFKETPRYTQSARQAEEIQELKQQLVASDNCMHYQQVQLQTKDQQLQDSQTHIHTLQQELQDSQQQLQDSQQQLLYSQRLLQDSQRQLQDSQRQLQDSRRQNQQLTHRVEETLHTIEYREQQLRQNRLQHEQTIRELQQTIDQLRQEQLQAVEGKQHTAEATEGPLLESTEQQLQPIKPAAALELEKNLMQQETIPNLSWKQSKAPERMLGGSVAVDANMVYCNGRHSTTVHNYDLQKEVWGRVTDCSYSDSCLVIVQEMLTTVGGRSPDGSTNSLLSLMGEGRDSKWSPLFPAMPTKRRNTAAVYDGRSLIVAGGYDGVDTLATVEVLDTNTRQWFTACSLLQPYSHATLGICDSRLYMLGGRDQQYRGTRSVLACSVPKLLQSCQTQSLAGKLRTLTLKKKQVWQHVADAPHRLSTCSVFYGCLVAAGGFDEADKETTTISAYNEKTDSWETIADMPTARCRALVANVSGKMMVIGGWGWTRHDTVEIGTVL